MKIQITCCKIPSILESSVAFFAKCVKVCKCRMFYSSQLKLSKRKINLSIVSILMRIFALFINTQTIKNKALVHWTNFFLIAFLY